MPNFGPSIIMQVSTHRLQLQRISTRRLRLLQLSIHRQQLSILLQRQLFSRLRLLRRQLLSTHRLLPGLVKGLGTIAPLPRIIRSPIQRSSQPQAAFKSGLNLKLLMALALPKQENK